MIRMAEANSAKTPSEAREQVETDHTMTDISVHEVSGTFGAEPMEIKCAHCNSVATTNIEFTSGTLCWTVSAIMLFSGLWLGCFLVPFCMKGLKDCIHKCSKCGIELGRYYRFQDLEKRKSWDKSVL